MKKAALLKYFLIAVTVNDVILLKGISPTPRELLHFKINIFLSRMYPVCPEQDWLLINPEDSFIIIIIIKQKLTVVKLKRD